MGPEGRAEPPAPAAAPQGGTGARRGRAAGLTRLGPAWEPLGSAAPPAGRGVQRVTQTKPEWRESSWQRGA